MKFLPSPKLALTVVVLAVITIAIVNRVKSNPRVAKALAA